MARRYYRRSRRRSSDIDGLFILVIVLSAVIWADGALLTYILYGSITLIAVILAFLIYRFYASNKRHRQLANLDEVDAMDSLEFESYIVDPLKKHGFKKVSRTEKYDMGVDVIGEKGGERWGIQVKRYTVVGASAVRQVIAGLASYKCDEAMVQIAPTASMH